MKFQKTVDMWKHETDIREGKIKLQTGQYVDCGCNEQHPTKSRFVGVNGNSVWVAHGSNNKQVNDRFNTMIKSFKALGV